MRRALPFVLAAVFVAGAAHADPTDADRATARSLAHEGLDAAQHGRYAVAADRFARANALVHAPTLLLGLARAQVALGSLVSAHETYERILREPLPAHAPAVFGKAVDDARKELPALTARLPWVTIRVEGPSDPTVTIDDVRVPLAELGVRRPCDPARTHFVRASAPGFAPAQSTFTIGEGETKDVTLTMNPVPVPPPTPIAAVSPVPSKSTLQKKIGIASLGLGAAGLITGGVAGIWVLTQHASLSGMCAGGQCPSRDAGDVYTYRTVANVSTAALIVGGVGAAAGVTLLLTSPKKERVQAYVGPMSAGVMGVF